MPIRVAHFLASVALLIAPAMAHDATEPYAQWYNSLKQPGTGVSCCNTHDCSAVDYRIGKDGYEANVDSRWISIPESKVLSHQDNPTGHAVLCMSKVSETIYCFVAASGT